MKIKLKELRRIIRHELLIAEAASMIDSLDVTPRSLIREMLVLEAGKILLKVPEDEESKPAFMKLLSWARGRIPGSESMYAQAVEAIEQNNYSTALELLRDAFMMMGIPAAIAAQ